MTNIIPQLLALWSILQLPSFVVSFPLDYGDKSLFKPPDPEVEKRLASWVESDPQNPEELGQYTEGDIVVQARMRNGRIDPTYRWVNGVIPYELDQNYTSKEVDKIHEAMNMYKQYTCVRPMKETDKRYISIVSNNQGCWSSIGCLKVRPQLVSLQSRVCVTKVGTILHELMHTAGFWHEHSRQDRDQYIEIIWDNVKEKNIKDFNKVKNGTTTSYGVEYDYSSVMHYSRTTFSANGKPTIRPKNPQKNMGQRDGFSNGDITKLNAMYNCPEKTLRVLGRSDTTAGTTTSQTSEHENTNPILTVANRLLTLFFIINLM